MLTDADSMSLYVHIILETLLRLCIFATLYLRTLWRYTNAVIIIIQ